ncbi:hypothetical protein [Cerasicoccus arenae]|uniref:Uncharacterized protein n=1 Tax=Cerasicoccus arenae TaxID=424488 RepID=A0A8J3DBE2_9BACT|nr:hypothetical protein [Cerasicoccus arenae]MBK1857306.1 hypothetical protein [Cerasicoccus arenae]GHC00586.1 hypothetical protein GCM10007047_16250 [Cerasicoccus arenae]
MKRFIATFVCFAAIQLLIMTVLLGLFFNVHFEKDPMAAIIDKKRNLKETPGERIIVVGDSGSPFGIVSPEIEKAFPDRHPINAGLAAGFGHRVLIGVVDDEVHAGDVVVICFVYEMFTRNLVNEFLFLLSSQEPSVFLSLDWRDGKFFTDNAFILFKDSMRHARKIAFNPLDRDYEHPYARNSYNEYGDIYAHYGLETPEGRSLTIKDMEFGDFDYARDVIGDLNRFAEEWQERGAQVFFLFPDVSEESYAIHGEKMNAFAELMHEELEFPILNEPVDAVQPEENFYDTPYHMKEAGARARTARLIEALKEQLNSSQQN